MDQAYVMLVILQGSICFGWCYTNLPWEPHRPGTNDLVFLPLELKFLNVMQ